MAVNESVREPDGSPSVAVRDGVGRDAEPLRSSDFCAESVSADGVGDSVAESLGNGETVVFTVSVGVSERLSALGVTDAVGIGAVNVGVSVGDLVARV